MLDQLRQIAIFAKVIDHGSFRAAATALQLSPSVVSHHITQLEERLGVALIYRSTRKLAITPDGERLLSAAHAMLDAAESGLAAISGHSARPSGELRITMPAVFARSALVGRIATFSVQYPHIQLHLDFTETRRDLIDDGFDIAIRAGWLSDSSLMARKVDTMARKMVVAPACLASRPAPASPMDLVDWPWIRFSPLRGRQTLFHHGTHPTVSVTPAGARLWVNDAQAMAQLALSGAGIAIVPEFLIQVARDAGDLVHLLPEWSVEAIGIYAVWPSNAPKDGLTRLFVSHLTD